MHWFGQSWGAPVCDPNLQVDVPVGQFCAGPCGKAIGPADTGVIIPLLSREADATDSAYHLQCFVSVVLPLDG